MFELAKIIHEAIGIQSPKWFIALFALVGLLAFGAVGWLIDKGYRVGLQEQAVGTKSNPVVPQPTVSPAPIPPPQKEGATPYEGPPEPRAADIQIQQHSEGTNRPNIAIVGSGNTVLQGEPSLIRSFEIHVDLDLPTAPMKASEKAMSAGVNSAIALFDGQKNPYRFATDYQYVDWQIQDAIHRFGFVYKPETPTGVFGKSINLLEQIDKLGFQYGKFISSAKGNTPLADGMASLQIQVVLNGISVMSVKRQIPAQLLIQDHEFFMDVASEFRNIPKVYATELAGRSAQR